MRSIIQAFAVAGVVLACGSTPAAARPLGVEVWTDRGDDGVYQPGQAIQVKVRTSEDAYLLVYGIDTEGEVSLLYPARPGRSFVEGRRTYGIPGEDSRYDLVVDDRTGQGFIVAIASREPFRALPWYLRPLDQRGEALGYTNYDEDDANDGITEDGRIVGDPYVAMERVRRRLVESAVSEGDFTSAYTGYYVHEPVRYPRYLCYDCHRPGRWAWWDGFDPYYTTCSVMDFRVNWSWAWGPSCWTGFVPYYYYVVRPGCPPRYRHWFGGGWRWSSWDGWARWNGLWGANLRRHKSTPPSGYVPPPAPGKPWRPDGAVPPGLLTVGNSRNSGGGIRQPLPIGRRERAPGSETERPPVNRGRGGVTRPDAERAPARPADESPGSGERWRVTTDGPTPRQPARPSGDDDPPSRPEARPEPRRPSGDSAPEPSRPSARPAPAEPRRESPAPTKPETHETKPRDPQPSPPPSKPSGSGNGGGGKSRSGGGGGR